MGRYSQQELHDMALNEPMKYFYYSREDEFKSLGLNLDNDDWEAPLYHKAGAQKGRDKFEYFYSIINTPVGATFRTPDDRIVNVSTGYGIVVLGEAVGKEPVFKHEDPLPAPEPLGFWFRVAHALTFGRYGRDRYAQYRLELDEHNLQTRQRDMAYEEFSRTELADYKKRQQAVQDHYRGLKQIGKDPKACEAVTAAHRSNAEQAKSKKESIRNMLTWREHGRIRLDYLMGPALGNNARNPDIERMIADDDGTIHDYAFEPMESEKDPEMRCNHLMRIKFPECKDFSDHEIALLGIAAMSSAKRIDAAYRHPIPGEAEIEDTRTEAEKLHDLGMWYNRTEALFARQHREITHSVPWVNNAKADVAAALEKYNAGDKSGIADILANGIRWCSQHVMLQSSATDSSTLADYAVYIGQMLAMADRDAELRSAMEAAGFTAQDYRNAVTCESIGTVWERGFDAMGRLANNPGMSIEERADAVVDIIGMRVVQAMVLASADEIRTSKAFSDKQAQCLSEISACKSAMSSFKDGNREGNPKFDAIKLESELAFTKISILEAGFMQESVGLHYDFGSTIYGMLGDRTRPEELRDVIRGKIDVDRLSALSCDNILVELLPQNSHKYVAKLFPQKQQQPAAKAEAKVMQKQNAGPVA